ncbi:MAG TPA: DUF4282 domain-containing protein [Candidatus Binatia bacterium]|nr:DUF4282 domain-containing protein [Candidatus Binatia bacterium]
MDQGSTSMPTPPPAEQRPPVAWQAPAPVPSADGRRFSWGDFFNFRYMVTPVVVKVVYIIGAGLITLAALGAILGSTRFGLGSGLLGGLLILLLGNLYWRVVMEIVVVFFGIHEGIRNIERKDR